MTVCDEPEGENSNTACGRHTDSGCVHVTSGADRALIPECAENLPVENKALYVYTSTFSFTQVWALKIYRPLMRADVCLRELQNWAKYVALSLQCVGCTRRKTAAASIPEFYGSRSSGARPTYCVGSSETVVSRFGLAVCLFAEPEILQHVV